MRFAITNLLIIKLIRLVVILALVILNAAEAPGQYKTRLDNDWEFHKGDLGGIWEAVRSIGEKPVEDILVWEKTKLPDCFNAHDAVDPDQSYYQGVGWYRTLIDVKNPYRDGRTLLHFEGAGQKTDIYVYTKKVGTHVGGYDEWTVDITDALEEFRKSENSNNRFGGKVPLVVRCDNSRDLQMIPSSLSDFTVYGGIYRYLNLVYVPALSIDRVQVTPTLDENGKASVHVMAFLYYTAKAADVNIEFRLITPEGKEIGRYTSSMVQPDSLFEWTKVIEKPVRWSPEQPFRYTVHVTLSSSYGTHHHREKIGIRDFRFQENGPFILNGKRLLLKGTHRHEDHAGKGNAMTEDLMRKEMVLIKNMGVNFIRLGHYQQSRIILDLCDSLGIMVWEEIPWCRGGLGNNVYKDQARRMLTNMIQQHYNHPSVIIWGLGNENDWPGDFPEFDKEKIRSFMKELNALSHALDPSRKTAIRRCDFCKDIVDVYSPSIWAGWYRGQYKEYKQVSEKEFKSVKHFLHAEWGGDSHAGRHSEGPETILEEVGTGNGADERNGDASPTGGAVRVSKDGDWSETYVCNLIDWHLKEQETMDWLTGSAYWVFKDFATPLRPENPVPYVNQKGVVERDLKPKSSYHVFQSYWSEKPMIHIYGHTWPVRWGNPGEQHMIKVYSNCDEVELIVNKKNYGIRRRNSQDFPAAGLRWMVALNEGNNVIRAIGRKGKVVVEDQIAQQYQTAKWSNPSRLLATALTEEADTVTVQVNIVDSLNTVCLNAANWIHFSLAGDGILVDNQGTSSGSRKVQAYNGRAIIKVKRNGGKNILCIQSPSLPAVFLSLEQNTSAP